jgi:hypothetical protein
VITSASGSAWTGAQDTKGAAKAATAKTDATARCRKDVNRMGIEWRKEHRKEAMRPKETWLNSEHDLLMKNPWND